MILNVCSNELPVTEGLYNGALWYRWRNTSNAKVDKFDSERLLFMVDQHNIVQLDVAVR